MCPVQKVKIKTHLLLETYQYPPSKVSLACSFVRETSMYMQQFNTNRQSTICLEVRLAFSEKYMENDTSNGDQHILASFII